MRYYYFLLCMVCATMLPAQYQGGWGSGSDSFGRQNRTLGGGNTAAMYGGSSGRGDFMGMMDNEQAILPLELLSFTATQQTDRVRLDWVTVDEREVDYFTVTRSDDGVYFEAVGSLDAGRSPGPAGYRNYRLTDTAPLPGVSYYRLKWVDYSGRVHYAQLVRIARQSGSDWNFRPAPNPTTGRAVYLYLRGVKQGESFDLRIIDDMGRAVSARSRLRSTGSPILLATRRLAPGVYTIQLVRADGSLRSSRLTVAR